MTEHITPDSLSDRIDEGSLLSDFDAQYFHSIDFGSVNLLLNAEHKGEIIYDLSVTSVPHAPSHLLGIANIRGKTVPVFLLDDVFNEAIVYPSAAIYLMLQQGKDSLALRTPALPRRVRADSAKDIVPVLNLSKSAQDSVLRTFQFEKPSMLFDPFKFFSSLAS